MFEQLKPVLFFILPAVAVCFGVGFWAWRRSPKALPTSGAVELERRFLFPLVVVFPFVLAGGWWLTLVGFQWPPATTKEWLPLIALAAGLVGLLELFNLPARASVDPQAKTFHAGLPIRSSFLGAWLSIVGFVAVSALAIWLLSRSPIQNRWTGVESLLWVGGGTIVALTIWAALLRTAYEPGRLPPLLFVVAAAPASATMLDSGEIHVPMLLGGACACVGSGLLVSLARPTFRLGPAIAAPAVCLAAAWYYAIVFGDTPRLCAVLGVLAVLMVPISALGPLARLTGWKRWAVRLTLVLLPGLASMGIARAAAME